MFRRTSVLFLATVLLLLSTGVVLAQDALPTVFCGDLDAEDCELLQASAESMADLTSGTTTTEFDIEVNGLPGLPISEADIALYVESAFVMDPDLADYLEQYAEMDPDELMSNPDLAMELSTAVLQGMDTSQFIQVEMSPNLAEILSAELEQPVPDELILNLRLIDGILYIDLASLAEVIPQLGFLGGWMGVDLVALTQLIQDEQMGEDFDMDAMQGALIVPGLAMGGSSMQMLGMEEQVNMLEDFIQVQRLQDAVVDDEPVAIFSMTVNFGDLISSPEFLEMVISQMQATGAMDQMDMTAGEMEELGMVLGFVAPMLFQDLDFEVNQAIGLDEPYLYDSELVFDWDLGEFMAMAESMSGDDLGLSESGEINMYMGGERSNRDFDGVTSIPVPEGALVLPINMLMQLVENL